jgi:hypothetical protein
VGIRYSVLRVAVALAAAALILYYGSNDVFWADFFVESWPAYHALQAGGLADMLHLAPAYAGFVTLFGAPFAELGLGMDATMRLVSLPGLAVLVGLALSLKGADKRQVLLATVLAAGSPIAYFSLAAGHPEETLAAAAAAAGVLAAVRNRATLSAVLIAVAIIAKQTGVLALLPAALALPRPKLRVLAIPVVAAGLVYGGLHLLRPPGAHLGVGAGGFFHPWQIWWPLGVPSSAQWMSTGGSATTSPAWLAPIPHPLIVLLAAPLSALWWWRSGHARPREDALLLLALLGLERCMLDPWDLGYYHLPAVLAILAWETEKRRMPVITLAVTGALWLTFKTLGARAGVAPYLTYLAWTLPLVAMLVQQLYLRREPVARPVAAFA